MANNNDRNRGRMVGCDDGDKAATALAMALDILSGGKDRYKNPFSGVVGASFRPSKGGWVVHNTAWALWGGLPTGLISKAMEILDGVRPEDPFEERYGPIGEAAAQSHWASKGKEIVKGVVLEDGTTLTFNPRPTEEGMQVGESVVIEGEAKKIVAYL